MADSEPSITKRQHYVPQFYLRTFCGPTNELQIFDCGREEIIRPRGTKAVCQEEFFYGVQTGVADDISQQVERRLSETESKLSIELPRLTAALLNGQHISDTDKWLLAMLMSMLWIRGPAMRSQIKRMAEQMFNRMAEIYFSHHNLDNLIDEDDAKRGEPTPPDVREKAKEFIRKGNFGLESSNVTHMQMFDSMTNFANLFHGQDWTVFISRAGRCFLTSDNPVVVLMPQRSDFYGPTFLERQHVFALCPEICIVTRFPHHDKGKKLRRRTLFADRAHVVDRLNRILAHQAIEYAYARERESLEALREWIKKNRKESPPQDGPR